MLSLILSFFFAFAFADIPSINGYSLTWSDDFTGSGRSLPDGGNWRVDTGTAYPGGPANWGTGEVEVYTNSPDNICQTGNGLLQITPLNTGSGWTSGRIETQRGDFMARDGGKMRIQANIMMPAVTGDAAAGYWPAFWSLGSSIRQNYNSWPSGGEFDIMENVDGLDKVWGTLHCGTNPGGPCNESNGLGNSLQCPGSSCQGNWHTYTVEVDRSVSPQTLKWFVDGQQYQMVTQSQVGDSAWNAAVGQGVYIILNVAMGGGFPNAFAGNTPNGNTQSGVPMLVDYVAVYNA